MILKEDSATFYQQFFCIVLYKTQLNLILPRRSDAK